LQPIENTVLATFHAKLVSQHHTTKLRGDNITTLRRAFARTDGDGMQRPLWKTLEVLSKATLVPQGATQRGR
jgi:hypothetical protein